MTPLEYYQEQCANGRITSDSQQIAALQIFEHVYANLIEEHSKRFGWTSLLHRKQLIKGIYLWGGVGIGKTFLMDCFYHSLPFKEKLRMHFHQFLQRIHHDLTLLQGKADPLQIIAKNIAKETLVLCFDEFFVSDITDAMLLGRLLKALFDNGVCLVTTSNIAPDDLYKNGLQRLQFLPAIATIKAHTEVINIPTTIDYRLRHLQEAGVFYSPLNEYATESMQKTFSVLTSGMDVKTDPIEIHGRMIPIIKKAGTCVWFEFKDICNIPRSQNDYLAIAEQYKTVFVSDIPVIPPEARDQICLFISLVDVFYDAKVRLVISAAEPVPELYSRGYKILEYTRTNSRLLEMQSVEYFSSGEE